MNKVSVIGIIAAVSGVVITLLIAMDFIGGDSLDIIAVNPQQITIEQERVLKRH